MNRRYETECTPSKHINDKLAEIEDSDSTVRLTNNSALVAINSTTRTSNVFFNNVKSNYIRRKIRAINNFPYTKQDLPRHQKWKKRGRKSDTSVIRKKTMNTVTKRHSVGEVAGGRERKKIIKIGGDSCFHPLCWPLVENHGRDDKLKE